MSPLLRVLGKFKLVFVLIIIYAIVVRFFPDVGESITAVDYGDFIIAIILFPPVFILVGLAEEWIDRELMVKLIGDQTGFYGHLIAFLLGSFGMGPLYVAFPIALMLLKKGSSFRNMYIFLGAWSTTRIQQLIYEVSSLGLKYTTLRLSMNFIGILIMATLIDKTTSIKHKNEILEENPLFYKRKE